MADKLQAQLRKRAKKLKKISSKETKRAASFAINRTAQRTKTKVVRGVAQQTKIKAKEIRKRTHISRAKPDKLVSRLTLHTRSISAASLITTSRLLKHRGTGTNRRGVRVAGRQFDSAFINLPRRGGRFYVFQRKGNSRYPLKAVSISFQKEAQQHMESISVSETRTYMHNTLLRELRRRYKKLQVN